MLQALYSACHLPRSRSIDAGDSVAPSPSSPRIASSKSPFESPCRYNSGNSALTARLWRANSGNTWLSKRSSRFRARGRCSATVPHDSASLRGLPWPLR